MNDGGLGLSCNGVIGYDNQQQQLNILNDGYNISPQKQEYNIPVSTTDYQYVQHSPYSDSQSPYNISQPSPDSQGRANMMKLISTLALVAVASAQYAPAPVVKVVKEIPQPYAYEYGVADDYSKANFRKTETQDAAGNVGGS